MLIKHKNIIPKMYYKGHLVRYVNAIDSTKEVIFRFNPEKTIIENENFGISYQIKSSFNSWKFIISIDGEDYTQIITDKNGIIYPNEIKGENLPIGIHSIIITIYEENIVIGCAPYSVNITEASKEITITSRNKCPYISTYYIEPIIKLNETNEINFYIDDYEGSYYKELDTTQKFKVYINVDGFDEVIYENLSGGDHTITIGPFTDYGFYEFSLQCEDEQGRKSHILWNEIWVKEDEVINEYIMTEDDLTAYNITNKKLENIVPVYIAPEEYEGNSLSDVVTTIMENKDEVINYKIPSGEYAVFLPDIDNDGNYDYYSNSWINNAYIRYAADYNKDEVITMATNTRNGLQRLINDKAAEGYNKVTLLPGYYIVEHREKLNGGCFGDIYIEHDNFTLDLNGSTIKLNSFTGSSGMIINLSWCLNSHVINGFVDGDAFTHDYENSPDNSEWVNGMGINGGCRYSSFENVVLTHSSGYGYVGGISNNIDNTKGYILGDLGNVGSFTNGDLDENGKLIEANDRSVSDFVDVSVNVNAYINETGKPYGVFQVSLYLGYQGNGMANWCFKLCAYDKDRNFLGDMIGYQYRNLRMPVGTKYIRIVAFTSADHVSNDLRIVYFNVPVNCVSRNLIIKEVRGTGGAWTGQYNSLFENIDIINAGNQVTPTGFDLEDGWDQMQDVTFRNVNCYDGRNSSSHQILTCGGHNIIIEDIKYGGCYVYERTRNYVLRNCNNASIDNTFGWTSLERTGNPRIYNVITDGGIGSSYGIYTKDCKAYSPGDGGNYIRCSFNKMRYLYKPCLYKDCSFDFVEGETGYITNESVDFVNCNIKNSNGSTVQFPLINDNIKFHNTDFNTCVKFTHNLHNLYCKECEFNNGIQLYPDIPGITEGDGSLESHFVA